MDAEQTRARAKAMMLVSPYSGRAGTATPVNLAGAQASAVLSSWLLHLPGQSMGWDHYQLSLIHLADILGLPPAHREYPEADLELGMWALNDVDLRPDPEHPERTFVVLTPQNYVAQFHGVSDAEARWIAAAMARYFCDGHLPAEPKTNRVVLPKRRSGGLIVPGQDKPQLIVGADDVMIDDQHSGRSYTAREWFKRVVWATVEHGKTGGQHDRWHLAPPRPEHEH